MQISAKRLKAWNTSSTSPSSTLGLVWLDFGLFGPSLIIQRHSSAFHSCTICRLGLSWLECTNHVCSLFLLEYLLFWKVQLQQWNPPLTHKIMPDHFTTGELDIRSNFDNLGTQLDVEHSRNVAESSVQFILQFTNLVELAIAKTNLRLVFNVQPCQIQIHYESSHIICYISTRNLGAPPGPDF